MTINFKARVLLELGAELISSDGVALYELVKNGIDAGSSSITIDIGVVLQPSSQRSLLSGLKKKNSKVWEAGAFRSVVWDALDVESKEAQRTAFMDHLGFPKNAGEAIDQLKAAAFKANYISVRDTGSGMTLDQLQSCYLTVGTPTRLLERKMKAEAKSAGKASKEDERVPLGEKGIGRLAAMRLGHHVTVETGVVKQGFWNELVLDWRPVFENPNLDASELTFTPTPTKRVKSVREKGTTVMIRDLQSDWTGAQIIELGRGDFSKLKDPFKDNYANKFLGIKWQGDVFKEFGVFLSSLLDHADAKCTITYRGRSGDVHDDDNGPRLDVAMMYRTFGKALTLSHEGVHLKTLISHEPSGKRRPSAKTAQLPGSDEVVAALSTVGDFDAEFHWFNRGRFMREEQTLWDSKLRDFVRAWSGGFLVYRDDFRVYPYGSVSDDWLDLDRKALSSGAYKLNRQQIVGFLRLTSQHNPRLQDQTNREGFRDGPEKEALRRLLRQAIVGDCKTFLESVDRQNKPADAETIKNLQRRIDQNQRAASNTLKQLRVRVPKESAVLNKVIAQLREVEDAWGHAKEALEAHEDEVERYIHLAGVGLMVELIAHELARSTAAALELLAKKDLAKSPKQLASLEAQLKTLSKRVRILDELSIPGRQVKSIHDLADTVDMIVELYGAKKERHGVDIDVKVVGKGKLKRRVERGQILQILDNLLSNAFYWLARRIDRNQSPLISIEIDLADSEIRVFDNGPGVPTSTGNQVFEPFYTTKPPGEGRGLGLYIARRLAEENGAVLKLLETGSKNHRGFALTFKGEDNYA